MNQLPGHVGVYGGGRMGGGIAHAFLLAGSRVTVIEISDEAAAATERQIAASVQKTAERSETPIDVDGVLGLSAVVTAADALTDCDLVIEAVPEDPALKASILAKIESIAPHAVIGTNTSSLSIDQLAAELARPERFLGLHFFNPVPASALVEIVVGKKTNGDVVSAAQDWVSALGKTAITVTDSPGFASSRLGVGLALEAMRMLESGVASAEDIDKAMTLGYRHPVGPLRTTDIVGLDVRLAIAEHLAREVGSNFTPPEILREKVARGELGRKTGQGFFEWKD